MAVKIALAVGLFIVICGPPALKSSQVVPDGLVYTEVKKTLVRGVQAVLTCRFYEKPIAVFWKNGLDPDDLSLMVIWHDGEVSGPRYDDGSCDVDANYSLIIKNVSTAVAGRIYCMVSNYKGILIDNYTDVSITDTAITITPRVTLQMRQATHGILQCTVHIKARRVAWKKGTTSSANESLVVIENNKGVAERSGAGYDEGSYNITQDYSLVIPFVKVQHEGLYMCEVTDFDTGISFQNQTYVNVVAEPLKPFPTIQECFNAKQHDPNYCTIVAKSEITLSCEVIEYYPDIKVFFLHGSTVVEPLNERELKNTDGTKNKTVTIATSGSKELYTCVASNIPGTRGNISSSVLLHSGQTFQFAVVVVIIVFAASTLIFLVACLIWRKKYRNYDPVQQIELQAKEVKDLTEQEIQQRVNDVLIQHCRRAYDLLETESPIQSEKIIGENKTALFDTQQMLTDWQQRLTPKDSQHTKPVQAASDIEDKPDYAWPSNEELLWIARHLTQESMKNMCKTLSIEYKSQNASDEGKRFESLRKWRNHASNESVEKKYKQLTSFVKSNKIIGLLPTLKGPHIYKAELVDLAFDLLIHDLFPVAKELGINATKLVSYRPVFDPSHLEMGTIKLLAKLLDSTISYLVNMINAEHLRRVFYTKVGQLGYRNVEIRGVFEYDMSYGELCSISDVMNQLQNTIEATVHQATSDMQPGPGIKVLQDVLQLTDQDTPDRLDTSHPLTAYEIFKIWKEKPRPSVFNYRGALAHGLRRHGNDGMPGLADEIIAGKYITEQTSLQFIENMVRGLNQDQIRSLGELFKLSADNEHWHTTTPLNEIIKQIYDWVAHWTGGMKGSWYLDAFAKPRADIHRNLNDKLVELGFLDLAREIMIIERQQLDRKTVVEYVKDKIF